MIQASGHQAGTRHGVNPHRRSGFARSKGRASARRSDSRARSTLTTRWRRPITAPAAVGEGSVARDDLYPEIPFRRSGFRSEEHTAELQSLRRISYAVFCVKKNKTSTK